MSNPEAGTRVRILDAAYLVAERSGVAALTLDAVAAEAAVSKGGLLYHFPSKEALLSGMVDGLCRLFGDLAAAAQRADPEPLGELWHSSRWMGLVGAMALNPALLDSWRADVLAGRAADEAEGVDPAAAAIVRLAADGLWVWGVLGLPGPDRALKAKILAELNQLTQSARRTA